MTRPPSCLSELAFASLLQYGPDGTSAVSKSSQEHVRWIKRGSPAHVTRIGDRMVENIAKLGDTFGAEAVLVPVPRSRPLKDPSALWPAMRIAEELMRRRLGRDVLPLLVRRAPIEKSALLRDGSKRPGPEDHTQTIDVVDALQVAAHRIVLVDDVVVAGRSTRCSLP